MENLNEKKQDVLAELSRRMAVDTIRELGDSINQMPIPGQEKTALLLTTIVAMMNNALDALHHDMSDEEALAKKLDFYKMLRSATIRTHAAKKEKKP